ncbi:MAG: exodeoxyribonuclease VII large subunit [Clostridia bacterium]|nr:exodeoxyribonuclease VII large subunit [Clostridia bacterium]
MASKLTLSVSQLNEYVRKLFQLDPMLGRIDLTGEIANLKFHQSGMLFFTMRDEQAAIACMMPAQEAAALSTEPFEGMRAVVSGSVGLYARAGRYQFYANSLRPQGMGVLYERLLALKAQLETEGLFQEARKRPIPGLINTVGVVSSPTGAVIHDILNVSLRRDPQARIRLCPARVQGIGAAEEIARAIRTLEAMEDVDVIIVARGGGSLEDLWAFNEERVVRAVTSCSKPVVSAVGHETDVTLCDLAADLRVPTPSAAAECVVAVRAQTEQRLEALREELRAAAESRVSKAEAALGMLTARLGAQRPDRRVAREQERLARLEGLLRDAARRRLQEGRSRLEMKRRELQLLSPYGALSRGYAIVTAGEAVVQSAASLAEGETIALRFKDGVRDARVIGKGEGTDDKRDAGRRKPRKETTQRGETL